LFGVSEGCINAKKEGREGGKKGRREEGVREINRLVKKLKLSSKRQAASS
jgi:hypothetical protein